MKNDGESERINEMK